MIDCLILGDSIAVGTAQARPECVAYAKVGINSRQWNQDYSTNNLSAKTVVISLGSNDYQGVDTHAELLKLRKKIDSEKVYWIMPAIKPDVQTLVEEVANMYGDWIIIIPSLSNDGIHPTSTGYRKIGAITK
jgi:hypothetical protein